MNAVVSLAVEPRAALTCPETEAGLLGGMMYNNNIIDRVADRLTAEDFAEPLHARIFSAIVKDHSLGRPANPVTLRAYFTDDAAMAEVGVGYLGQLTGSGAATVGWSDFAEQIRDLSRRRRVVEAMQTAIASAHDWNVSLEEVASEADAALTGVADDESTANDATAAECINGVLDSFNGDAPAGVSCMIHSLNDAMGPINPTNLVILAGRPGMGKTALGLNYAVGAARKGHGVLFISIEMSREELSQRMVADISFDGTGGIPLTVIQHRKANQHQMRHIQSIADAAESLPLRIADVCSPTIGRISMLIRRHARRMAAAGQKLELVVVDYLGLVRSDHRTQSRYETITEVSNGLKAAAKEHRVGIMALAQLSRGVESREDKRPSLADLRDSGSIEQDADTVVFLLRPEYYLAQTEPAETDPKWPAWAEGMAEKRGQIEFIVAKRRHGVTGVAQGQFHGAYQAVRG